MRLKNLGAVFVLGLLSVVAVPNAASAATIGFTCLTDNTGTCSSYAGFFSGQVTVSGGTLTALITNSAGGSITAVYADTPATGFSGPAGIVETPPAVDFSVGGNPTNVPGASLATPTFTADFYITANNPAPTAGANFGESVGLTFLTSLTQSELDALLANNTLRFALHVTGLPCDQQQPGITCQSTSESFISTFQPPTTVPEPASMILLGTGLLAAARARRRKVS